MVIPVDFVLYRRLSFTDWQAIHGRRGTPNGGGERHIALDKIASDSYTTKFLGTNISPKTVSVTAIGRNNEVKDIVFKDWGGGRNQWTASDQAANRHPAITQAYGLPDYDDPILWTGNGRDKANWADAIVVYWVFAEDTFYMGFVTKPQLYSNWLDIFKVFFESSKAVGLLEVKQLSVSSTANQIAQALKTEKNILLYGPPGTGKTIAMKEIKDFVENLTSITNIGLDPSNQNQPFQDAKLKIPLPLPVYTEWLTFHQNTTYEEFVVGLRPVPIKNGLTLQPRAGRLLEIIKAFEDGKCQSAILFIDELNRGNPAQVFGEMITFLETDKRSTAIYLQGVNSDGNDKTEDIMFRDGIGKINYPIKVPDNLYVIASINSLDRSVAPLDQALARRFHKISCPPEIDTLINMLKISQNDPQLVEPDATNDNHAGIVAVHLLIRINKYVSHLLGADFQFGHGYFKKVWETPEGNDRWEILAQVWDAKIFPQLEEMFRTRPDEFGKILKVKEAEQNNMSTYPYKFENPPKGLEELEPRLSYAASAVQYLSTSQERRQVLIFMSDDK